MNQLVVVIPSKTTSNLVPCLDAIRLHEPNVKVIVIDDGLEPGLAHDPLVTYETGIKPFVFSRAINQGLRAAGDADCIAINDDALLTSSGGFSLMQAAAEADPEIGIIGAVTNLTGQPLQRPQPHTIMAPGHRIVNTQWGLREVPHIAFVCVLIPRRTLNRLAEITPSDPDHLSGGLMDERYISYGCDDASFCMEVRRIGLKICVHDGCYVDHGSLRSSFRGSPTAGGDFSSNYKLLIDKWGKLDW